MDFNTFLSLSNKLIDVELNENQFTQLHIVTNCLIENNKKFNLTALKTPEDIISKHLADSLHLAKHIFDNNLKNKCLLDVGSGGGFPALPLSIYLQNSIIYALDSTEKKLVHIANTAKEADIHNINTIYGRAEELSRDKKLRESFDIVTARAVSRLNVLIELCSPFVKPDGYFVAMKGAAALEELNECKQGLKELGLKLIDTVKYELPGLTDERYLLTFKKTSSISDKYPRQYAKITKSPL